MKSLHTCFILGLMTFLSIEVNAQNQLMGITICQSQVEVKGTELYVNFDIDISALDIKSNQEIVLIPIIRSADKIKTLPKVIINGRNRQISYDRIVDRERNQSSYNAPYAVLRNSKKEDVIIPYRTVIPFEKWMDTLTITLTEDICGCGSTTQEMANLIVTQRIKSPIVNAPSLTYLSPMVGESIKKPDSVTSTVLFPRSEVTILLDYEQNKTNITRLGSIPSGIAVKSIHVIGSASPEGFYQFNEQLSKERALSLAAYLQAHYNISTKPDEIEWIGEDWNALLKLVEQSDMKYKQQVIDIIKKTAVFAGREKKLMELNSGKAYQYMQEHFFPQLRSASYTVYYQPTSFDVAKGRELITSNPQLLSVKELLLIANSYPHGSIEYKNAIETTAKMYPDNMVSHINASSAALSVGDVAAAKQYLERFDQQPESWNNLGVIDMIEGNYESAQYYFQKAMDMGNIEAVRNMKELNSREELP